MQVTKIMPSDQESFPASHQSSQEELQIEFNYMQAVRHELYKKYKLFYDIV